jgi:hypothetical protein
MFIVVPLWLALIILLLTRPVEGFKMTGALMLGLVIGLMFWVAVLAA